LKQGAMQPQTFIASWYAGSTPSAAMSPRQERKVAGIVCLDCTDRDQILQERLHRHLGSRPSHP
jgi:hypothetical protein